MQFPQILRLVRSLNPLEPKSAAEESMKNLRNNLQSFNRCRIGVIGDLRLAEYLWGWVAAGSNFETAHRLAKLAAAHKVCKRGTACVSANGLIDAIGPEFTEHLQS